MKHGGKKKRFALTLLLAIIFSCFLLITILIVGAVGFLLLRIGVFTIGEMPHSHFTLLLLILGLSCFFVGIATTALLGRIPLRPVNYLINGMNSLASGNFRTRLTPNRFLRRFPPVREVTHSFNTMAEELENTEILRSDFINNFSHEFKTPIVSIAGFAKLLRRGGLTEAQQQEYIAVIAEESMRLSSMATNVLNLTRVENQVILTDITRFNLSEQLRSSILILEEKWSEKHLDFSLEFGEHMICASEELLKQVWINLIGNAVKFATEGSVIEIDIREHSQSISVSILNQGVEISPDDQKRVFNKFYQADRSHASEGSGIGLAIVKRIVELHRGKVSLVSEKGLTVVTVRLPKDRYS